MRFLVDAQLPPALARWLREKGLEADHVFDRGLATATDLAVWIVALDLGAAIVTKDQDFVLMRTMSREGPPVIWIRLANSRTAELLTWFEPVLPTVLSALERGETLIEIA